MSSEENTSMIVGGGPKKVLYTLSTVRKIGFLKGSKALKSNNACKACALGMGGQNGGMVNELKEFPSVCNKSIQAQSTDIQPPIPEKLFEHNISDFRELSARELESLGRLNTPLFKPQGKVRFIPVTWEQATDIASNKFRACDPDKAFFYSSGRSSNEAGFLLQLIARLYGTNDVTNCSFYCHQATGVGLGNTVGTGTATVSLDDLGKSDCIFVIGANPSSNHPRYIHQLKKCRDRGGDVIVINPAKEPGLVKFAVPKSPKSMMKGGDWIASAYLQPNIGSDLYVLFAIAKYILEEKEADYAFLDAYTENFDAFQGMLDATSWDDIQAQTGIDKEELVNVAKIYAKSKATIFSWGMGITHHTNGVENVENIANLALLRGMVGAPGKGLLPLRGHSNVQGIGTIGVKPILPEHVIENLEKYSGKRFPTQKGKDTLACLKDAHDGNVDAALMLGGNLFEATPNKQWAEEAFNNINFKLYLTTTLNKGHINGVDRGDCLILPVTARDEEWEPTTQESMFNYVRLSDGGINRLDNVRPESHILCDIAKRIVDDSLIDFEELKNHNSVRAAIASTIPGMEELQEITDSKREFQIKNRVLHTPEFDTPTSKAQFRTCSIKHKQNDGYPFSLMTIRSEGQFNSIIYEESDSYRGVNDRWTVLLNQEDMGDMGITSGDKITIASPSGEMKDVMVLPFDVPKGNMMAYYPEANALVGLESDPRSHTPSFKNVPVKIIT